MCILLGTVLPFSEGLKFMDNKLWILRPRDDTQWPWKPWYGRTFGFVVSAPSAKSARSHAAAASGQEGIVAWTDPGLSSCRHLVAGKEQCVLMEDFARA